MHEVSITDEEPRLVADVEKGLDEKVISTVPDLGTSTPRPEQGNNTTPPFTRIDNGFSKSFVSDLPARFFKRVIRKSNALEAHDDGPPPDGGVFAWITVFICTMIGFNTFGFLNAYGVLQTHYVSFLGRPPSDVSWIGSLQAFLLLFVGAFSGRLMDAGYFHQSLFLGTVLQLLGFFAASVSTTYWQLLLSHGICIGLGGGLVFCPAMSLVGTYFYRHRSLALAICAIGNSIGGLIFAAILQNLLPTLGYGWAMRVCGFLVMASMVPANFVLRTRAIKRVPGPLIEWRAFKEPEYAFFASGMFVSFLGMWVPVFYLGSFARDIIGVDNKAAASLLLLINGVGIAGRVLPAILAAKCGPLNLMIPLSMLSGLILFSWASVTDYTGILIFDVFYGFIMAAAQGMFPPSLGSLTTDLSKMGVRFGMVFSICGFALLIGQPLAGALISLNEGKYLYAQMYAGSSMLLGVGFLTAARVARVGWKVIVMV